MQWTIFPCCLKNAKKRRPPMRNIQQLFTVVEVYRARNYSILNNLNSSDFNSCRTLFSSLATEAKWKPFFLYGCSETNTLLITSELTSKDPCIAYIFSMVFTCTKILILNGIQKHNVSCADLGFLVDLVTLIQMTVNLARFRKIVMRRSTLRKKTSQY